MFDLTLSEEQLRLQKKARDFAINEVLPAAWHYDSIEKIPVPILKKAHAEGLMNSDIPKEYGGQGLGLFEAALMSEEISAASPGLATTIFGNSLGSKPLYLSDNDKAKRAYLPLIASEFRIISFATSETSMGSDVAGIRCLAKKDGDDYILIGTKYWITNAEISDYITVFATIDPKLRHDGICAFLIHRDWPGVYVGQHIPKMGQRISNTAALKFDNVRVPRENVLAEPGEGFKLAMKTFARTRPVIGALATGAARAAMEYAISYAKKRQAFGSKLGAFQAIQHKIADMYQKVETSRMFVWRAAWEADHGMDSTISASIAKFHASESAMQVVSEALQIFGGYGYTRNYPLEQLFRDTRLLKIYEGTSEIQRTVVATHAMNTYRPLMPPVDELPLAVDHDLLSEEDRQKTLWRCSICGYIHEGSEAPDECPVCFMKKGAFKKVWPRDRLK